MRSSLWIAVIIAVLGTGCGLAPERGTADLVFVAPMNVDSGERFHVSLGVENRGETPFRDYEAFNGAMMLTDRTGTEVGRVEVTTLWELPPGEAAWPGAFAARLAAGAYQLTWGAPAYGSVTVDFTIVELEGRLYLGREAIEHTGAAAAPDEREYGALQSLVDLARVNLAQRLEVDPEAVAVQSIDETEFPDASLGVPEPGELYAQVLTPGLIITLAVDGETHTYHAGDTRLVYVPTDLADAPAQEPADDEGAAPEGSITISGVEVARSERVTVHGTSTLPQGTCLGSELWADGEPQNWWPSEVCVPVQDGAWALTVPLDQDGAPAELDPSAQYMVRVYQQGGPNTVSVFAFDLAGPPTPAP